jgi:type IV pilus assembly protein PilA
MKSRKGFTLIELMIVVVIVAVLAAIVVPLLLSRVEKSKYSEGKAIAGQIATAVRTYVAEATGTPSPTPNLQTDLGFKPNELDGKYFNQTGMSVSNVAVNTTTGAVSYDVTCTPNDTTALSHGNVVLHCVANVTTFTSPVGI